MCKDMSPLELAIQFHGHICPGLLMGVRAAELAQKQLGASQDQDQELMAVVETNSCGVDAIQAVLGCTFGKGNLIFKDHGKNVYTIASRTNNRAVRIAQKHNDRPDPDFVRYNELNNKTHLTDEEDIEKENLVGVIFEKIMSTPVDEIFSWQEVTVEFPSKAVIYPTVRCEACGEGVMESRAAKTERGYICPCCA